MKQFSTRIFNFFVLMTILFMAISGTGFSQQETFKVLASRGKVLYQAINNENWGKLTIGCKLYKGDKIKLVEDVYLSLVHSTGKTIELKKEGTYEIAALEKQYTFKKLYGNTGRLINFILKELGRSEESDKNMVLTGATERSANFGGGVKVFMPRNTKLIDSVVTFCWYKTGGSSRYTFRIADRFARNAFKTELSDTALVLDLFQAGLKRGEPYYWSVDKNNQSAGYPDEFCFTILTTEAEAAIKDTLQQLNNEFEGEITGVNKMVLASFYERNELMQRAMSEYQESLSFAPDIEGYKQKYASFLIKIGLVEMAHRIWE